MIAAQAFKVYSLTAALLFAFCNVTAYGAAIDTNGHPVSDATDIGDIDGDATTVADLRQTLVPDYDVVTNAALNALSRAEAEAGYMEWKVWYSDGNIITNVYNGQTVNIQSHIVNGEIVGWYPTVGGEVCGDALGDKDSTSLSWDSQTATIASGTIFGTRHIITPTKISQLTNDVGFVTASEVTNSTYQGKGWPFSQWTYTPPTLLLSTPCWTNNLWRYTETNALGEVVGSAKYIESAAGMDAVQLTDTLNGTNIVFSRTGEDVYTNNLGLATLDNLKSYVKHTQLEQTLNDYVTNEKLDNYDASYKIVEGISSENQTIQYVLYTNSVATPLQIALPQNGRCKDWIVYVLSEVDLPLSLPPAIYWVKDEAVTNSITAGLPTALYFSQISTEGVYSIGRQEYITLELAGARAPTMINTMDKILKTTENKKKKKAFRGSR